MFSKPKILTNEPLAKHLTMRVNQVAKFFIEVKSTDELFKSIAWAKKQKQPFFILGGGSNIVFIHDYPGLVIKISINEIKILHTSDKEVESQVSSGTPVSILITKTIEMGLSGFEYHQGLPGTVGGAIFMNAKWTKPTIYFSDRLINATLLTKAGKLKKVDKDYFKFAYDYSILHTTGEIILDATFCLTKKNSNQLKKIALSSLNYRKITQPFGVATSGCFFQNIRKEDQVRQNLPTNSAGYLIDKCGLKNYQVGGFRVSPIHANFIVNTDKQNSKSSDLIKLIKYIKSKAKEKFNISLKEEVQLL